MIDTDLFDTLVAAARWNEIAGVVAWSGEEVLFDDYEARQGRNDIAFKVTSTEHSIKFLIDLYDFVSNQVQRKKLRHLFRQIMALRTMREWPFSETVAPLRTRLREHKMFVICGLDPPDPDERRKGRRDDAA